MKALAFAGITGVGKSTLTNLVRKRIPDLGFDSWITFSSFYTQNMVKYKKNISKTNEENYLDIVGDHFDILKYLDKLENVPDQLREIGVLYEEFLFNAIFEYNLEPDYYKEFEQKYVDLGGRCIFLKIDEDQIMYRTIKSTRIYRNEKWLSYQKSFQKTDEELEAMYISRQRIMERKINESKINSLIINTTEMKWKEYESIITDFWSGE
ncbi:hypothetical protein C8Z91_34835 [Paenibacillus elgii]|uniref:Deoxynucleoside kinase domain-containing protein n=1 Tax=Paenibacillus elgii TaxID=189691 RepID=A0A2T6FRV2_9BACL|nr:hypothetical protein [Paenibacillus elgii]PUA34644.1 hypothetical protein C8Z91_34835 [Paenibacillus elgii]